MRNELATIIRDVLTVSFISNCWKSRAGDNYISLTLHVISDFELKTYILGDNEIKESHTAQTLRSYLVEIVNYWSLPGDNSLNDKLFQCIVVTVYYFLINYCFLCNSTFFLLFIFPYKLFIFLILTFYLNFDVKKNISKFVCLDV